MTKQTLVKQKKKEDKAKARLKFKYVSNGAFSDKTANEIGLRIESLKKKSRKQIVTAKEIVQDARNPSTPYHKLFTWEDGIAAERYRESQAREILGNIVEVRIIAGQQVDVRTFVNIISEEGERGYASMSEVRTKPQLMNQVIVDALKEAKLWNEKWRIYKEVAKISNAIEETLQEFEDK